MKKVFRLQKLRDISISKKLYFITGAMALLIAMELAMLWFAIDTLSSVRALVGAEGLWSKAQKDAAYSLRKYYRTHDEETFNSYRRFLQVTLGDHVSRLELMKEKPNIALARQGFLEGRVHPDDIDGIIKLLRRFDDNYYIKKATAYWIAADSMIALLVPVGNKLHAEITSSLPSKEKLDQIIAELDPINLELTTLEDNFSYALGEGSRWLEDIVLKLLLAVALTVEITGLVLTIAVSRGITKGLNEINRAAKKIAGGELNDRAAVYSNDEIGKVATAINQMTAQLLLSNKELEQFAYLASHDLQEPLRKLLVFTSLLEDETKHLDNGKGKEYMDKITASALRMQRLVKDVLQFSQLNLTEAYNPVDLNKLIAELLSDMELPEGKTDAQINVHAIPILEANETQMRQLFQNLVGNAVKFTTGQPKVDISAEIITSTQLPPNYLEACKYKYAGLGSTGMESEKFCRLYVKDNGIGFDEKYLDKIFTLFQRLHERESFDGTGIGLAICKKILENHNGYITAVSTRGYGATFILILPLSQKNFNK